MTDTSQELAEQAAHEQRMCDDIEYATRFTEQAVKDKMEFYLNSEGDFIDLNKRYEIVDMGQVMRALRNLDTAISVRSNRPYAPNACLEAVFTALSNIHTNFTEAIKHESKTKYERDL